MVDTTTTDDGIEARINFSGSVRSMFDGWARAAFSGSETAREVSERFSTVLAVRNEEEVEEVRSVLSEVEAREALTTSQKSAIRRVRAELVEAESEFWLDATDGWDEESDDVEETDDGPTFDYETSELAELADVDEALADMIGGDLLDDESDDVEEETEESPGHASRLAAQLRIAEESDVVDVEREPEEVEGADGDHVEELLSEPVETDLPDFEEFCSDGGREPLTDGGIVVAGDGGEILDDGDDRNPHGVSGGSSGMSNYRDRITAREAEVVDALREGSLTEKQALAFALREIFGYSRSETAELMGMSLSSIDTHRSRGVEKVEEARRTVDALDSEEDRELMTDGGRDERRVPLPVAEERHELVDTVADLTYDAMEFGEVSREEALSALAEVAEEIDREVPALSRFEEEGRSRDGEGGSRPVPPGVGSPEEVDSS